MLTTDEAQRRVRQFLTERMREAFRAVAYDLPPFGGPEPDLVLADIARGRVQLRHARGASDAGYLVEAFDDALHVHIQLNLWRLVVIYRIPAEVGVEVASLEPRLERWQRGAEHAGWTIGWREAVEPTEPTRRFVETYCYANPARDLLENELEQMFWATDIVQMTRALMLEAQRCRIRLAP